MKKKVLALGISGLALLSIGNGEGGSVLACFLVLILGLFAFVLLAGYTMTHK